MEPNNPQQNPSLFPEDVNRSADATSSPEQPTAPPGTTVIVRSSSMPMILMVILCVCLGVGLMISLVANMITRAAYDQYFQTDAHVIESHHSGEPAATKKIAIVSVSGVMIEGEGFTKRQLDRVREDENVEAIVLRVNSPGGAVTAADYLYHHIKRVRDEKNIPIVVSMGSVAASGGYYVAMAATPGEGNIYCEPTGITGSIGVIMPRYDISEMLAKFDVKSDSIVSHEHKEMGSWTKELTPEERRRLQGHVDLLFNRFKDIVRQGRPLLANDEDALDQVATGEVFTGLQAKELMLVDEVGFIEDAIERAAELAKLESDDYRVVQFDRPPTLIETVAGTIEAHENPLGTKQLLEMTTPRAYYLYSWLPGFAGP